MGIQGSIRLKLTALVATVVVLTAAGLSVVSYVFARNTLRNEIRQRLTLAASDRQKQVLNYINDQSELVDLVASRTRLNDLLGEWKTNPTDLVRIRTELQRILNDALRGSTNLVSIWLTDESGQVLVATDNGDHLKDIARTEEWRQGPRKSPDLHLVRDEQGRHCTLLAAGVSGSTGARGAVMMLVDAERLRRVLVDREGLGKTGNVSLGARRGNVVCFFLRSETAAEDVDIPLDRARIMGEATAGRSGFIETIDADGRKVLAAYRAVGFRNWGLVTQMDEVEAYAPINWLRRMFITVEVVIFILGIVISYWLATRFTRPMLRMAKMAESIASGGMHAQVVVESTDEIGRLGQAFNKMSEELAHYYAILEDRVTQRTQELQAERDLLQGLLDSTPDRIYFKDTQSRFTRVNNAQARCLSLHNPSFAVGKSDADFFSQEHADQALADEQRVIQTGQPIIALEEKETWPDGRVSWVSTTKAPLRDQTGKIIGTFGISRDITEQKLAREELNRYFELSPDLFCIAGFDGRFKRVSPSWTAILGYSPAELLANPFMSFVHPDDRDSTLAEYDKIKGGTHALQFENRYRCKDGSYRWLQWNTITVVEQQIIHAVARDVSEHKRAQELLSRFADALNKKNVEMQEDLKLAREVHQIFLPQDYPSFPANVSADQSRIKFAHRYLPTSALGGDFFDILPISDTEAGIFICDVMGHGMRAALVTSIIRGQVDKYREAATDPSKLLQQINLALLTALRSVNATIFATACYLVIDVKTGQIRLANAGHPAPLMVRPAMGLVERLTIAGSGNTPLGLLRDAEYATTVYPINPRDRLLVFTDGLIEVETQDGRQYGLDRLEAALRSRLQTGGVQLLDELVLEARSFSATGEFTDDVCLVSAEMTSTERR